MTLLAKGAPQTYSLTGGPSPVAQFLCSAILSSFPRQMSRQTLHINRNLLRGLFHQPPGANSSYQNTIQWLHTLHKHNTARSWRGGGGHIRIREKIQMPALVNRLTNLRCSAEVIYSLKTSHWPTMFIQYMLFLNVIAARPDIETPPKYFHHCMQIRYPTHLRMSPAPVLIKSATYCNNNSH